MVELSKLHWPMHDACVAEDGLHPWLLWQESSGCEKPLTVSCWQWCWSIRICFTSSS